MQSDTIHNCKIKKLYLTFNLKLILNSLITNLKLILNFKNYF